MVNGKQGCLVLTVKDPSTAVLRLIASVDSISMVGVYHCVPTREETSLSKNETKPSLMLVLVPCTNLCACILVQPPLFV